MGGTERHANDDVAWQLQLGGSYLEKWKGMVLRFCF